MRCLIRAVAAIVVGSTATAARADGGECRVSGDLQAQVERCSAVIADAASRNHRAVAYLYRCQAHDLLGRHRKALEDCLTSADLNAEDSSTFNSLNIVYRNLGRLRESVDAATTAIGLKPEEGAAFAGRASAYCAMGRFADSLDDRLRAIELGYLAIDRVQRFLADRGFYGGEIDGTMGGGTRTALQAWTDNGC